MKASTLKTGQILTFRLSSGLTTARFIAYHPKQGYRQALCEMDFAELGKCLLNKAEFTRMLVKKARKEVLTHE